MKILIVYYSYDGNTEFIANVIANHLRADKLKLEPQNEKKVSGFKKFFWGGKQVFTRVEPVLKPFDKNPAEYDVLIIGTPVWAWRHAPALEAFFNQTRIAGKKVALFCCHGGGPGGTLKKMSDKLQGNDIIGKAAFLEPLSHGKDKNADQAKAWVEGLGLIKQG